MCWHVMLTVYWDMVLTWKDALEFYTIKEPLISNHGPLRHQFSNFRVFPLIFFVETDRYIGLYSPLSIFCRYEGLDRYIKSRLLLKPNSFRFVASKVAIDGFIFGPLDLLIFFTYMGFAAGKSVPQIKEDVKRDFLPAFVLEGGIWPIVQVVNFRFVPVRYQLLYVNFFCLLDSSFLSWLEQQEDAPWKQWLKSCLSFNEQKGEGGWLPANNCVSCLWWKLTSENVKTLDSEYLGTEFFFSS